MRFALVAWICLSVSTPAVADDSPDLEATLIQVREHFAKAEYEAAKQLLLAAYASTKRDDLLFALGQAELNLHHYKEAIAYYQQYLDTHPPADAVTRTHVAIAVAEERFAAQEAKKLLPPPKLPPPPPPPPRRVRDWDVVNSTLAIIGGAGVVSGVAVFAHGYRLGGNTAGTLASFDRRVDRSVLRQQLGVAIASAGVVAIGASLVRWRVRRIELAPVAPVGTAAGLTLGGVW